MKKYKKIYSLNIGLEAKPEADIEFIQDKTSSFDWQLTDTRYVIGLISKAYYSMDASMRLLGSKVNTVSKLHFFKFKKEYVLSRVQLLENNDAYLLKSALHKKNLRNADSSREWSQRIHETLSKNQDKIHFYWDLQEFFVGRQNISHLKIIRHGSFSSIHITQYPSWISKGAIDIIVPCSRHELYNTIWRMP